MDLKGVRFLLVEDNSDMANIVRALLATWGGGHVRQAGSVAEALDRLGHDSFDLAIVDYKLPDGEGVNLVRTIRRSPLAFLPVLMLTANGSRRVVADARDSGVNEFLVKPFTAEALYRRLHAMIFHPRPFITSNHYVGPDRRRRQDPAYQGPERRGG